MTTGTGGDRAIPAGTRGPRRRPWRPRAAAVLPLALAAWVLLEVWLLSLVGRAAGVLTVVLLLLAGVVAGGAVIRWAGLRAWRSFSLAVHSGGQVPPEPSGAAVLMLTGVLLMVPGLASDALGLLVLLPPVRAVSRRLLRRLATRGGLVAAGPIGPLGGVYQQARIHRPDGKIIQGEVVDRGSPEREGGPSGGRSG